MQRRRLPNDAPLPTPMTSSVIRRGSILMVAGFVGAVLVGVTTDLPVNEPFDWLFQHHLHWAVYAGVIALVAWLWRPLQRLRVPIVLRLLLGPVLSFALSLPAQACSSW